MPYICPECSRTSKLPDFCCGRSMVSQGSYVCRECGTNGQQGDTCCSQPMIQV